VLKGRHTAVVFSIAIHLGIIVAISQTIVTTEKDKLPKHKAIKSFIYIPVKDVPVKKTPAKTAQPEQVVAEEIKTENEKIEIEQEVKEVIEKNVIEEKTITQKAPQDTPTPLAYVKPNKKKQEDQQDKDSIEQKKSAPKYSAFKQLSQLRNKLSEQMFADEAFEYSRPRTGSIMDGTPVNVPHSVKQFTAEEKALNATSSIGSLKVVKGDDGSCTIERDLSEVGIAGVKSVESFGCGENKFNKSFREHMAKIRKKLGK